MSEDTTTVSDKSGKREFDVVVFGATGFVGELTARYLATCPGRDKDRAGRAFGGQTRRIA